jgi:D-aspartate ligase
MKKPPVIIVGNHVTSLNIIRQLGQLDIETYLTHKTGKNISRYSKYCKKFFLSPPFTDIPAMISFLINLAENKNLKGAILIPTNDDTVIVLSQNKKELEKYFIIPLPEWNIINCAFDKRITLDIARKTGLPIPKPIYPQNLKDMKSKLKELQFPVVVKPAMGKKYYFAVGTKMHMAETEEEAIKYFNVIAKVMGEDNIIVQEYIPGPMSELYNYSTVMKEGVPYGIFTGRKLRQHPRDFGVGTAAVTVHDPELTRVGTELLKACEYEGIGYIEFKKDPRDGQYKLIEINPRLWNFMDLAHVTGVNIPLNLYKYAMNEPMQKAHISGDVIWLHFWTDIGETIKEVFKGNENLFDYFKSLKGKRRFAVASWKDPLPFIMETIMLPYLFLKR